MKPPTQAPLISSGLWTVALPLLRLCLALLPLQPLSNLSNNNNSFRQRQSGAPPPHPCRCSFGSSQAQAPTVTPDLAR